MAITGSFKLEIAGRPSTRIAGKNVQNIIDARVKILSPDAEVTVKQFAGLFINMTWIGTPKNIGDAQPLLGFLRRSLKVYFEAWRMYLIIDLKETGG